MPNVPPAPFGDLLKAGRRRQKLTQRQLAARVGVHGNTLWAWERGNYLPTTRGLVLELARQLHLDGAETRQLLEASLTALAPYWTIPFPRNLCFTGREELLQHLYAHLSVEQPVALTQSYALSGLGGIGKTQLALEYAYRHALEYSAVFWLAADTPETLLASLQQIAEVLQLPAYLEAEQAQLIAAVRRWLITHRGWLLIGDNVEDLNLLHGVLPPARQGAILLTTRLQALSTLAEGLDVPPMGCEEGIALLARRAKRLGPPGALDPDAGRVVTPLLPAELDAAAELVALLEGLPLALDQAGSYLEETGCSVTDYLDRYAHQRAPLLARRGAALGAHPASVAATVWLAVEQVDSVHPAAAELLRLCAFWHPEAIPEEVLVAGAKHLGPVLEPVVTDPHQLDLALAALRRFSLVTRHPEMRTIGLHRLVQAVLHDHLDPDEIKVWGERVIRASDAAFPSVSFATWGQCERCLPHALACVPLIDEVTSSMPEAEDLLYKVGSYLLERGRFREAESYLSRAMALGVTRHGRDHPALIPLLTRLGELYWRQGTYSRAEPICLQALVLGERYLGRDHLEIADLLDEVAAVYRGQGRYARAARLCRRALRLRERHLGTTHPQTGMTLHNLAMLLRDEGKDTQAEVLFLRALAIVEQNLGTDHPETAVTLTQLGAVYHRQGNYDQAAYMGARALAIKERQLGPEHPGTATSLQHLANVYRDQGRLTEAQPLYEQALAIFEEHLGVAHPQTAMALANLGRLYWTQGHLEQAEQVLRQSLSICEAQLGLEHPKTCLVRSDVESIVRSVGVAESTSNQRTASVIDPPSDRY